MVNPGTFRGSRKEFLESQLPTYGAAVASGYVKDAVAIIQRLYFKRYPIELPLNEEPSPEHLSQVNDDDPDAEEPDFDANLSQEEFDSEISRRQERALLITKRKSQIARWLSYHHMKESDVDVGPDSPYRTLLFQLTGKGIEKPRQKTPANVWRKTHRQEIEVLAKEEAKRLKDAGKPAKGVSIRDKIARNLFNALDKEEKDEWEARAKEEHAAALREYELARTSTPSTKPEDRQRCIQGLTSFVKPILDLICEATGWKTSLIAGGPEPAMDGRLNIMSIHSGECRGEVKMNFGRAQRPFYKKQFVTAYGNFLKMCYTPEECRDRALPHDDATDALDGEELGQAGVDLDQVQWNSPSLAHASEASTFTASSSSTAIASKSSTPVNHPPPSQLASSNQTTSSHAVDPGNSILRSTPPPADIPESATHPGGGRSPDGMSVVSQVPSPRSPGFSTLTNLFTIPPSPPPFEDENPILGNAMEAASSESHKRTQSSSERDAWDHVSATFSRPFEVESDTEGLPQPKRRRIAEVVPLSSPSAGRRQRATRKKSTGDAPISKAKNAASSVQKKAALSAVKTPAASAALATRNTLPAVAIIDSNSTPTWFLDGCRMFENTNMGSEWKALVDAWKQFEAQEGYQGSQRLKSNHRPEAVALWIKNYRKPTWRPSTLNLDTYCTDFVAWWASLQPNWRVSSGKLDTRKLNGDWDCLRRAGANGLVGVLAALVFWWDGMEEGTTTRKKGKGKVGAVSQLKEKWAECVRDVTAALENLCAVEK